MNEVLVSETDNQLVFNYIEIYYAKVGNSLIECGEYTRMIVQIKDGKAKISLYDNGNRADRNIKITDWFKSNEVLENKGLHKTSFYALKDYSTSCKNTLLKLEKSISNKAEIAMEDF